MVLNHVLLDNSDMMLDHVLLKNSDRLYSLEREEVQENNKELPPFEEGQQEDEDLPPLEDGENEDEELFNPATDNGFYIFTGNAKPRNSFTFDSYTFIQWIIRSKEGPE
jgi:hypothetical protein